MRWTGLTAGMEMRILCKALMGKLEGYRDHLKDNIKMDSHGS
jgi:hypothetical protein